MKRRVTHYKPNVVYGLLIEGKYYYIGCHTISGKYIRGERNITGCSGNYLAMQAHRKEISWGNYFQNVELLFVEEFDTKEEAQDREIELIAEYKEKYGELCANKSCGNKIGCKGLHIKRSEEARKRQSEKRKGILPESLRIANIKRRIEISQIDKTSGQIIATFPSIRAAQLATGINSIGDCLNGRTNTAGGFVWKRTEDKNGKARNKKHFNNGVVSIMAFECPEGFIKGRLYRG